MYIPIFAKMFSLTELSKIKRFVVPTLAILSSLFMVLAAIYSHKWGVLYFIIIAVIIMCVGQRFYRKDKK
jgi:APA family basic amino acid/polyamine antiporter